MAQDTHAAELALGRKPLQPSLMLERRLAAAPARVYRAWTDPSDLLAWWGPAGAVTSSVETDPRVGGRFRIRFATDDGEAHEVGGTYLQAVPFERLAFTWAWHTMPERESRVTVLIRPEGAGSRLTLIHERFFDAPARDRHERGWSSTLDKLVAHCDRAVQEESR